MFCAASSHQVGEPLCGTAATVRVWILLESGGAWEPDIWQSAALSGRAKNVLARWLGTIEASRLQLIRHTGRDTGTFRLMAAVVREKGSVLLRWDLRDDRDLEGVDLPQAVRTLPASARENEPVHLVCTHGRRDPCCARWGVQVAQAFERVDPQSTWQTTHVGGHRFAANVVGLPHGIAYGRIEPDDAPSMVEAHRQGILYSLSQCRGRSYYPKETQAAEIFVRQFISELHLEAFEHITTYVTESEQWQSEFRHVDGTHYKVTFRRRASAKSRLESCDAREPTPAASFEPLSVTKL